MKRIGIVVPCYNEEEVLPETVSRLTKLLAELVQAGRITGDSFVLFVDDGSHDRTWEIIESAFADSRYVFGLKLAGNSGHQNALLAGMTAANRLCDAVITIDADLQDDETVIPKMIDLYADGEGCDIVYGVRDSRKNDSRFKRATAQGFYKFLRLMGVKTVYNHADYRLMSHRAVEQLEKYEERNLFLRGIVPLIGYKTDCVYYERKKRFAGKTKYPLKKMLGLALDGITSFSIKPISIITSLGLILVLLSIAAAIYALISYVSGTAVPGWSSLMLSIWFIGGVQLLSIGLVGQYIGKIYMETKRRPRYNVEKFKIHKS